MIGKLRDIVNYFKESRNPKPPLTSNENSDNSSSNDQTLQECKDTDVLSNGKTPPSTPPAISPSTSASSSSLSSSSTLTNNSSLTVITPTGNNAIACDSITNKLSDISEIAESLDSTLRETQNGLDIIDTNSSSSEKKFENGITSSFDDYSHRSTEDESFMTASECNFTPQSRSSSFQTVSETRTLSPYWSSFDKTLSVDATDDGEEISEIELDSNILRVELNNQSTPSPNVGGSSGTGTMSSANVSFDSSDYLSAQSDHSPLLTNGLIHSPPTAILNDSKEATFLDDSGNHSEESVIKSRSETPTSKSNEFMKISDNSKENSNQTNNNINVGANISMAAKNNSEKSDNNIYLKVVEIEPKLTTLGENIDEAIYLQKQHEDIFFQLKNLPTPIEEFESKADKLLTSKRINAEIVKAMGQNLEIVWDDMLKLIHDRKHILDLCANFHEKMGSCRGKMASLEVACKDTMIPMEIDTVQEFLIKFKQLRIDMLTTVMNALKDGNELLEELKQLVEANETGTLDSRPEHIRKDSIRAVNQVQQWLESLHDRRNALEAAWQTRKVQLEQCLALAILSNDLNEVERNLNKYRTAITGPFSLGECEHTSNLALKDYTGLKHDALLLRDRALKITRATEKLVASGCFAGNEACARAYDILNLCTEYLELCDQREHWLHQSKEFFSKAEKTLHVLEKLEIELSQVKIPLNTPESFAMYAKVLREVKAFTEEPLKLGYLLLDEVGRTKSECQGVKRVLDEIENRKIYIEGLCTQNSEEQIKIQSILTSFLEEYNEVLSWLVEIAENFLKINVSMGKTLNDAKNFQLLHHKLLQDLEYKGEFINNLLEEIKKYLESLDPQQRYDVDTKAEALHKHWTELKDIVLKRVDLSSIYIEFFEKAHQLDEKFNKLNDDLDKTPDENKLNYLENEWENIKENYKHLKGIAMEFINTKITDPYLEMKNTYYNVEEILKSLNSRQFDITTNWEKYTTNVFERKEIEILLERIMSDNVEISNKTTKLDTQLYPIFTTASLDPKQLQNDTKIKLDCVIQDVDTALDEIQQRIDTTLKIQTNDSEYLDKINKIIENLRTLKQKLDGIRYDYKILIENIINFLENIQILREQIDEYFNKNNNKSIASAELNKNLLAEHEIYRENIMDKFRKLIGQSEILIERIRLLEPIGAKEYDTDRILKLLELLRINFETNNTKKMVELEKQEEFNKFKENLSDINLNLDHVYKQLNDITKQNVENLANAKTSSLAFEYFERTIELLEKRIDNFINSSELTINTDIENNNIKNDLLNLRNKWEQFKEQVKLTRKSLNLTNEYFEIVDKIDCETREINYFYTSVANKIPFLREQVQATNLVNDIETYVHDREGPLRDKLKRAFELSHQIFQNDRTKKLQSDVDTLFQSFVKLKSDILIVGDRLRNEEKQKDVLHQQQLLMEKQAEIQKQQKLILEQEAEQQRQEIQALHQQKAKQAHELLLLKQKEDEQKRNLQELAEKQHQVQLQQQLDEIDRASSSKVEIVKKSTTTINQVFSEIKYIPPRFIHQICDAKVGEGDRFIFECQVVGNPEPTIEWFKDGVSILKNPDYKTKYENCRCTLQIDETLQADSGEFMCRASNIVGTDDTYGKLSVRENHLEAQMKPPQILRYLESGIAREGSSHEFRCTVTGSPLPTVQWYKNDRNIDDSTDYSISFNNGEAVLKLDQVFLEDNAVYTVNVINPAGFVQCSANLIVEPLEPTEAPRFIESLSNVMARVGQRVRLECMVTGIPQPEIYWIHNNRPFIGHDTKYENGRVTLIIPSAYPKDSGIYICTAKNLAGEVYSSCNVTVKGRLPNETSDSEIASDMEPIKPSVQVALKNIAVFEGKPVRLDCVIVGQPEPEVIWYHNDVPVKESPDVQLLFQGDRCSLVIHEAFTEDAGPYKVIAINSAGETSSSCTLAVTALNLAEPAQRSTSIQEESNNIDCAPKFEKFLSDILVTEGDTVELECIGSGAKPLQAKWYLSNKELSESNHIKFIQNDSGLFSLKLINCSNDDKGVYTVKISNNAGDAKCFSHVIVKSVNAPSSTSDTPIEEKHVCPTFTELFTDQNVHKGAVVKFECIVQGKPTPRIKWYFNDQPVQGKNFLISTSGNRQVLTIPEASPETVGRISCVAENETGKATCLGCLNLIGDGVEFPSSAHTQNVTQEHNTESSRVTIKKQTFTTTSTSQVNSYEGNLPQTQIHINTSNIDQSFNQIGSHKPEIVESHHYQEFQKTSDVPGGFNQKSTVLISNDLPSLPESTKKFTRKSLAPKFTTPLVGKIIDQGSNVQLEAIYDGYPSPEIKIQKNGEEIFSNDRIKISNNFHKINIDISNINIRDAGRYSVTASNPAGQSTSTADVVVKKTIFPPVFGHRLQAQVAKRNERVIMEVEVSGIPDPTVTWYKDEKPLKDILKPNTHKFKKEGNTYTLCFDKAEPYLAGKYMVKATNAGGEAQSIADFAILEPTPERFIEIVKTTVYDDKKSLQELNFKPEPLSFQTTQTEQTTEQDLHGTSESKIITEHRCTTEATMRLEHKPIEFNIPQFGKNLQKPNMSESTNTDVLFTKNDSTQTPPQAPPKPDASIESTSISKKASYEFFQKLQSEGLPSEKYSNFDEVKSVAETLPKLIPLQMPEICSTNDTDFLKLNLKPGTPPEIGFIGNNEILQHNRPQIKERIKQLGEIQSIGEVPRGGISIFPQITKSVQFTKASSNFTQEIKTSEGPIFRPQACLPSPAQNFTRSPSPKPSAEGVAMEKLWATKPVEYESGFSDFEESKCQNYTSCSEPELAIDPPKSIKETKKIFEEKIVQQKEKIIHILPQSSIIDLKAPGLVKEIMISKSLEIPKTQVATFNLEPGTPPEICFAPKPEERRKSLVEIMEATLEQDLQKGPSKVLPHSIPTFAPPPLPPKEIYKPPPVVPSKPSPVVFSPLPPPPCAPKFVRTDVYESDYESDRIKYSGSESDEPVFRNVKPSTLVQRPKSIAECVSIVKPIPKISGYSADTEESVFQKHVSFESKQQLFESKHFSQESHHQIIQPQQPFYPPIESISEEKGRTQLMMKNISINSKDYKIREEPQVLQPFPYEAPKQAQHPTNLKAAPPPSPSKFIKGEFRESDYSDHDERYATLEEKGYRPVRPNLTPTSGRQSNMSYDSIKSPTPPTLFEQPSQIGSQTRPKFEPIKQEESIKSSPQAVYKPKPVAAKFMESISQHQWNQQQQQQHQKIFSTKKETITRHHQINTRASEPPPSRPHQQQNVQYYRGIAGTPLHHATMATETHNVMHLKESTESTSRIFNMEQTKRLIHFDEQKFNEHQKYTVSDSLPYSPIPSANRPNQKTAPPSTPNKFVPGEFRESDYDSEIETARIVPLWNSSMEPRFKHVEPPRGGGSRSTSLPRSYITSPLEFDRGPQMPSKIIIERPIQQQSYQTQTLNRYSSMKQTESTAMTRDDMNLQVGSPPKYGYIADHAKKQAQQMSNSVRDKTCRFMDDISQDIKQTNEYTFRPGFKRAPSEGDNTPQAYRNESRVSQYGTKCIDPNTGLIYFKYDFGYEFGILFPGEGKKFTAAAYNSGKSNSSKLNESDKPTVHAMITSKTKYPLKQSGDIHIPVQHIRTTTKRTNRPLSNIGFTSECDYTEPEFNYGPNNKNKRYSLPLEHNIEIFNKYKLPGPYLVHGQPVTELPTNIPVNTNIQQDGPKRPPTFITPLKDIAVVSGQGARFECIVQCDPHPNIQWYKNGIPLENNSKTIIEFRNGVCRLTVPQTFSDDSGTYSCTGSNELGSVTTTAELIVPGNNRGTRF